MKKQSFITRKVNEALMVLLQGGHMFWLLESITAIFVIPLSVRQMFLCSAAQGNVSLLLVWFFWLDRPRAGGRKNISPAVFKHNFTTTTQLFFFCLFVCFLKVGNSGSTLWAHYRWLINVIHVNTANLCFNLFTPSNLIILLCISDLGYSRSGAVPVLGRGFLPRSGLLRPGVWCYGAKHLQDFGQLAGWVLDPGQPSRSRELPLCGFGQ